MNYDNWKTGHDQRLEPDPEPYYPERIEKE